LQALKSVDLISWIQIFELMLLFAGTFRRQNVFSRRSLDVVSVRPVTIPERVFLLLVLAFDPIFVLILLDGASVVVLIVRGLAHTSV
jgi:hypothetical protein